MRISSRIWGDTSRKEKLEQIVAECIGKNPCEEQDDLVTKLEPNFSKEN